MESTGTLGTEIVLHEGRRFVYLKEHDAERRLVSSTWAHLFHESIEDHYMKNYLAHIKENL